MDINKEKRPYHLGLVLSGGGARGFAHLGVYKAMQELGIKPDIISGTSAGAIAGAMIASGHTAEESLSFFLGTKMLDFARPVVSKMGVMMMGGMEKRLSEFIQVETFDQLQIPLVVTATNMNLGIPAHFNSGKVIPSVVASSSVPIVFVPMVIDNQQYVDGGVFMNLPVRPIRDLCDIIIGVHIDPVEPSNHIKNLVHLAERSFHMGILSNMNIDAKSCDILIMPKHISRYSMFDLNNTEKIFDEGYKEAMIVFKRPKIMTTLGLN
ncbi:patatin-like phospholipase family protein [uncultured Sanguibacteroides sp.]|uniref:patatin-like phospholipase family protein n=1 Tax=uncultured Sanguibacteroides sp. TaxID=1635151 RepID=UPI0025F55D80|nr:patatin-like phospholipase family protein [uncultured Sanguibacteroides sp.]